MVQDILFYRRGDLSEALRHRQAALRKEITSLEPDYVLKTSESDLREYFVSNYRVEAPQLLEDQAYQEPPTDTNVDVNQDHNGWTTDRSQPFHIQGTLVTIVIPFGGEADLFHFRPSRRTLNPPRGEIVGQELVLKFGTVEYPAGDIAQAYDRQLGQIKTMLDRVSVDVARFNESLPDLVSTAIHDRKEKVLADRKLASSIGVPIRRRDGAPQTYAVPGVKRKPKIRKPKVPAGAFEPEPALDMKEYEYILRVIKNMVVVMERSPSAFAHMKEEHLRDQFLVPLNGHYEGEATGETFNYGGKTDILLRHEGKNVFIAECKFWDGEKSLSDAIDQLLSYASWRDTKTAIILFSRRKNFSAVLEKVPDAVRSHRCYKRDAEGGDETTFRYLFGQPDDPNREVHLTVLAFNVPTPA